MLRLDKVIKPWKEAAALSDHINLYGFWNESVFLTKSGDVGMVLRVSGVDYESLDHAEQEYAVKRLEAALKAFGPGFHVYLGAALLVIAAAVFSSTTKKTPAQLAAAKGQPPQPTLQDNTDNNVQDLKNQLKAQRDKDAQQQAATDPALASATPAQRAAAAAYGPTDVATPCIPNQANPGQSCQQAGYGQPGYGQPGNPQPQLSPEQQQAQLIAAKERERADESRFASNLVFAGTSEKPQQAQGQTAPAQYSPVAQRQDESSLLPSRAAGEPPQEASNGYKRPIEANIDQAGGQRFTWSRFLAVWCFPRSRPARSSNTVSIESNNSMQHAASR
jgi:hypothetical protein